MNNPEQLEFIRNWLGSGSINIFGLPFSGKDSQGKILADLFNGELIGGGQILRESVIPDGVRRDLDSGILVPTADFIRIVLPFLSKPELAGKPLILSAVGRWHGEEDGVVGALDAANHPTKAVINLSITEESARRRWLEHENHKDRGERRDDSAEILENRFSEFSSKTLPVLEYYRERDLLIEIDGNGPRSDVTNSIISALANRVLASQ
ncbi:MAG TPA: nucleoside monophosphate kinase [Candidatus Saccharibacteria bacterium]|nr:nucleoside monophosphate kinase [Candidatus Saccharibacteria bacterium]